VMTPDGRTIYVPYLRAGTVMPISTATDTVGRPIPVPDAINVMFTRNGRTAFAVGSVRGRGETVTPISTTTNTHGKTISIGRYAGYWAFAPDGRTVYVIDYGGTSVIPISTRTGRAGPPIPVHGVPAPGMAITPDGRTLYLSSQGPSRNVGRVTPISLATRAVGKPLTLPGYPLNLVMTPDGRTAYTFSAEVGPGQVVTPVSTATNVPGKPIRLTGDNIVVLVPGDQDMPY
jgi:hyaluronoglucosaminidase